MYCKVRKCANASADAGSHVCTRKSSRQAWWWLHTTAAHAPPHLLPAVRWDGGAQVLQCERRWSTEIVGTILQGGQPWRRWGRQQG